MRPPISALTPLLVVSDLERSIDFYCRSLGFVDPNVHGDPPCFGMINRDGFDLMLSVAKDPATIHPHGPSGTWDIAIRVTDLAAEMAALAATGVRLDKGPTDTFYEMREIEILDPDGHRVCLGQDITTDAEAWEGTLDLGSSQLRLVLKTDRWCGELRGRLDSLDQGTLDMPIDRIVREGSALRFEMRAIGASFKGVVREDGAEMSGLWSQRGRAWPLVLRRKAGP
jgi:catechol 2,3-dioxygenase-like lactoylglutathione lyase family enzyme